MKSLQATLNESVNQELYAKALEDLNQTKGYMSKLEKVEGWAVLRHQGFDATADIKQQMHKTSLFRVPDEPIYVEFKNKWG